MCPCELSGNIHLSLSQSWSWSSDITSETSLRISGKIIPAFWMCPSLVQHRPSQACLYKTFLLQMFVINGHWSDCVAQIEYRIYFTLLLWLGGFGWIISDQLTFLLHYVDLLSELIQLSGYLSTKAGTFSRVGKNFYGLLTF